MLVIAEMAELADAHGSGPCDSNIMRVQVPFSALNKILFNVSKPLILLHSTKIKIYKNLKIGQK